MCLPPRLPWEPPRRGASIPDCMWQIRHGLGLGHQRIARRLANLIEAVLPTCYEVVENRAWKPAADEFIPDVMVFDRTDEQKRLTAAPHLVVEILCSDWARDITRRAAKYDAAGVERYWIIHPDGPEVIVYRLANSILAEQDRHGPGTPRPSLR